MTLFEPIGHFFFEKNRAWLFYVLLGAPFLIGSMFLAPRFIALREVEQTFGSAALRAHSAIIKKERKESLIQRYSQFDPYFIDQYLESLPLLQKELTELQSIQNHPACVNRETIQHRIAFLSGTENRLAFAEENIRSSKRIKETEEKLLHPVEIDVNDLEHLLSIIENISIGEYSPNIHSPQLLIQNFCLTKKNNRVNELNLTLLKREFSNEKN